MIEDKRVFARINVKFPLNFLASSSGIEGDAETVDISANGVGFVTSESLASKTPLEMWLNLPDKHEPFYTRGDVVWSEPSADANRYRVGVQLEKAQLMGLARALWIKK